MWTLPGGNCDGRELTNIYLVYFTISCVDCILRYAFDGALCEIAVWLEEGLKVPFARRDASAAQRPFGDEHVAETRVVLKSFSHLFLGDPHCFRVGFGAFDELCGRQK